MLIRKPSKSKILPISIPSFTNDEERAVINTLRSGWVSQGPEVKKFEELFAKKHGVKYAVATSSGTTALHLMLLAAGIGKGDEVLVPSFTWVSTANVVQMCGAVPILIDIDLETFNTSIQNILPKITPKTKAIIIVHLFGKPVDINFIRKKLPNRIIIFEDAACATGGSINKKMIGSHGMAAAFSFHPRKVITTGEGGMITSNSPKLIKKIKELRNHGIPEISLEMNSKFKLGDIGHLGYNFRMTDIQAAIGIVQLNKIDDFIIERNAVAQEYISALKELTWLQLPKIENNEVHTFQTFLILVDQKLGQKLRNDLVIHLYQSDIMTRPGTHAIHTLGLYRKKYRYTPSDLPKSLAAYRFGIALPLFNGITRIQYEKVINRIRNFSKIHDLN
jgi:dTDP-4-amino-4,6-dideoxygalactose transaminase